MATLARGLADYRQQLRLRLDGRTRGLMVNPRKRMISLNSRSVSLIEATFAKAERRPGV